MYFIYLFIYVLYFTFLNIQPTKYTKMFIMYFIHLFIHLYIMDLINARKMEYIKV